MSIEGERVEMDSVIAEESVEEGTMTGQVTAARHPFEQIGLGRAPYRFVSCQTKVGPIDLGNGLTVGAPGQPMSSCDYCGTGIAHEYWILSADGIRHKVGSECIKKADDAGLRRKVDAIERDRRNSRTDARINAAIARMPVVMEELKARPHPMSWERERGKSLADWAEWMLTFAGRAGKLRVARLIESM